MPPFSHVPNFSGMSGLGKVIGFEFAYIVFKQRNKVYSKKIVSYYKENDTATPAVAVSSIVIADNDSIFILLSKSIKEIENEEIYPFIYQFKDSAKGLVYYEILSESHPSNFVIECIISDAG
ncbi:MAG TPA: hypothetical protein VK787_02855 [Puia sp.]|nr:hypothetical protein [Puia sp.]